MTTLQTYASQRTRQRRKQPDMNPAGMLTLTVLAVTAIGIAAYVIREAILSRRDGNRPVNQGDGRSMSKTLVGRHAYVTTTINHLGVVTIGDETWTAQSQDRSVIPKGTWVTIIRVQNIKVIVKPEGPEQTPDKIDD